MGLNTITSEQHVPILERALLLLEHLLQHPKGLGVSDIANQLGFPKNSVYRIVNTLQKHGYLNRDAETKRFVLSRKMFSMAYSGTEEKNLMENALDIMRELRDEVRETVLIGIISDGGTLILEQVPGLYSFRFVVEPGTRRSIHASSNGKAILAYLPEREQHGILDGLSLTKFTERTIISKDAFRAELQRVRDRGYAFDIAEEDVGVHCASAPILDKHGIAVAAITATGPAFRFPEVDMDALGQCVKKYAGRVSQRLGHGLL